MANAAPARAARHSAVATPPFFGPAGGLGGDARRADRGGIFHVPGMVRIRRANFYRRVFQLSRPGDLAESAVGPVALGSSHSGAIEKSWAGDFIRRHGAAGDLGNSRCNPVIPTTRRPPGRHRCELTTDWLSAMRVS